MFLVQAYRSENTATCQKTHLPNIGPYSPKSPRYCVCCYKLLPPGCDLNEPCQGTDRYMT
jgi:hypothetical protein